MPTRKVIVITGASDGIGAAAARALSARGHRIVLVGRSREKTQRIAQELEQEFHVADFAELEQVRALAHLLLERHPRIDVLANNAGGVFGRNRQLTIDGHWGVTLLVDGRYQEGTTGRDVYESQEVH